MEVTGRLELTTVMVRYVHYNKPTAIARLDCYLQINQILVVWIYVIMAPAWIMDSFPARL